MDEKTKITVAPRGGDECSPGAVHVPVPAGAPSWDINTTTTAKEKEEIRKLLSGYQIEDCTAAEVEVVGHDDEEARNQQFAKDLQKETRTRNLKHSLCVVMPCLELLYWSFGGDDGYFGWFGTGFLGFAVGMNAFGFAFLCLLLLIDYRLKQHHVVPVDECTVLNKVTKRFCCGSFFRKSHHFLVKYRLRKENQQHSVLTVFPTAKSRYDYLRIGDSSLGGHVFCRHDNPKIAVYQPPERGSEWRWNIIKVALVCFVLHWISVLVAFVHPKVNKDDAFFVFYLTLGLMVFSFPYLFITVASVARRKIEDYFHVEQATVVGPVEPVEPEQESLQNANPIDV